MAESQKLQFPLERSEKYKAKIIFSVVLTKPAGGGGNRTSQTDITETFRPQFPGDVPMSPGEWEGSLDQVSTALPPAGSQNQTINLGKRVVLYMPPSLQINDGVDIGSMDFGTFGNAVRAGLSDGSGVVSAVSSAVTDGIGDAISLLSGNVNPDVVRTLVSRFSGMGGETIAGAVRTALQTTPNPNTRAIFRSVNLREFGFTFKLQPTTKRESDEITNIIKFFRTELYPETIREAATGLPIAYRFPNKMDIKLAYGADEFDPRGRGATKRLATKIKRCYLKNFSATYNSSGMSFMEGGEFAEVDLSMTFMEESTLDKNDIVNEGY